MAAKPDRLSGPGAGCLRMSSELTCTEEGQGLDEARITRTLALTRTGGFGAAVTRLRLIRRRGICVSCSAHPLTTSGRPRCAPALSRRGYRVLVLVVGYGQGAHRSLRQGGEAEKATKAALKQKLRCRVGPSAMVCTSQRWGDESERREAETRSALEPDSETNASESGGVTGSKHTDRRDRKQNKAGSRSRRQGCRSGHLFSSSRLPRRALFSSSGLPKRAPVLVDRASGACTRFSSYRAAEAASRRPEQLQPASVSRRAALPKRASLQTRKAAALSTGGPRNKERGDGKKKKKEEEGWFPPGPNVALFMQRSARKGARKRARGGPEARSECIVAVKLQCLQDGWRSGRGS
ncbi:hypothetical protein B0H19DRAFT_1069204 [Mycena capillaripes]|nr:hypothetical protein B0H19DRAFT_1069204 [Mycena capillaripes]